MPLLHQPHPPERDTGQINNQNTNADVQTNTSEKELNESVPNSPNNRHEVVTEDGVVSLQVDIEFKHELEYTEEKIFTTSLFHVHKLVSEWIKAKVIDGACVLGERYLEENLVDVQN